MKLAEDIKTFIKLLNAHHVKYIILGGYAVAYHGYPRFTGDIDIFVAISEDNARKLAHVLKDFDFESLGLTDKDFLQDNLIIQLGYSPNRIDILTSASGLEFQETWLNRINDEIDGVPVFFISKSLLIKNKQASGRLKDTLDIQALTDPTIDS